jgi:hypothetical protein
MGESLHRPERCSQSPSCRMKAALIFRSIAATPPSDAGEIGSGSCCLRRRSRPSSHAVTKLTACERSHLVGVPQRRLRHLDDCWHFCRSPHLTSHHITSPLAALLTAQNCSSGSPPRRPGHLFAGDRACPRRQVRPRSRPTMSRPLCPPCSGTRRTMTARAWSGRFAVRVSDPHRRDGFLEAAARRSLSSVCLPSLDFDSCGRRTPRSVGPRRISAPSAPVRPPSSRSCWRRRRPSRTSCFGRWRPRRRSRLARVRELDRLFQAMHSRRCSSPARPPAGDAPARPEGRTGGQRF